jgi:hypothetical protein
MTEATVNPRQAGPGEQREHPRQWLDQRHEGRGNYLCVAAAAGHLLNLF